MRVGIGSDHAGFVLKTQVAEHLIGRGVEIELYGATSHDRFDYPIAADEVARRILDGANQFGILVCGSGVGVCIRANRYHGIRAAQCLSVEMARLARQHNHANVLCLGERIQMYSEVEAIVDVFLSTGEDHSQRHDHRVELVEAPVNL